MTGSAFSRNGHRQHERSGQAAILDRLRARYGVLDHAMRANERYSERRGSFFAAGLTYYTILSLFRC
ncbi:putative ribonuclease domain protein [Mycobacterium xenopi 3993]|nr:putative ribonuclease domain protein [Mycobacterium xenopi 3993]